MRDIYIYEFDMLDDMLAEEAVYNFFGETTVYDNSQAKGKKDKLCIAVYPDEGRNFAEDPYFKVSWQTNFSDDGKIARIEMSDDYYVVHNNITADVTNTVAKNISKAIVTKCKDKNRVQDIKDVIADELSSSKISQKEKDAIMNKDILVWDSMLFDIYEIENGKVKLTQLQKDYPVRKFSDIDFKRRGNEKFKYPRMIKWGDD